MAQLEQNAWSTMRSHLRLAASFEACSLIPRGCKLQMRLTILRTLVVSICGGGHATITAYTPSYVTRDSQDLASPEANYGSSEPTASDVLKTSLAVSNNSQTFSKGLRVVLANL